MKNVKSKIIPIPRRDIDTDLIIPADFLTITDKKGLGEHVFSRLRAQDEDFPFNLERYQGAEILVVRENFGCGSSREHAAWALKDFGIRVVIAPSFADIFYNNALKNGLLPLVLTADVVEEIFQKEKEDPSFSIEVDLEKQEVSFSDGEAYSFEIDPYQKHCLIEGMDDMDYLLSSLPEIKEFDRKHADFIFFDVSKL